MRPHTKAIVVVALTGVSVSVALAAAAGLSLGAGNEYGPGITSSSVVFAITFFVINPLHFLLVVLPELRIPEWLFWPAAAVVDLGWWVLVGYAVGAFLKRRKYV